MSLSDALSSGMFTKLRAGLYSDVNGNFYRSGSEVARVYKLKLHDGGY